MMLSEFQIGEALAEPFSPEDVRFLPKSVKGNRAAAVAYVSSRAVQERLDSVVGIGGWKTEYLQVGPTSVECRLSIRIGDEWVTKADVGSTSEQPDEGDRLKAAYSDALKRCAVQWGVARYLYKLPVSWCDYDPNKKQFTQTPQLPQWALPKSMRGQQQQARPQPVQRPPQQQSAQPQPQQQQPQPPKPAAPVQQQSANQPQQPSVYLGTLTSLKEVRTQNELNALRVAARLSFEQGKMTFDEGAALKTAFEDKASRIKELLASVNDPIPA